ncbi:protein of unknown function [Bradyrhizobium vignae]|uniref:Uncharacterized protein n=2 Tax=Bradyrhizobium vignae TaxID=1549949 RepID=A0A2U3Q1Q6_9BRAD|nr:protein of unknown function [Bradyrhizobium vignae]
MTQSSGELSREDAKACLRFESAEVYEAIAGWCAPPWPSLVCYSFRKILSCGLPLLLRYLGSELRVFPVTIVPLEQHPSRI